MPRIPLIIHLGAAVQLVPVAAYAFTRLRTRSALLIALGCLISLAADLASLMMSSRTPNNHLVTYLSSPVFAVLLLAGLREWQLTRREQQAFTVIVVVFLISVVGLVAFVEDVNTFNRGIGPMYSLALLVGGLWTLGRRTWATHASPIQHSDWFWVSVGLAVYGASTALASPIGGYLIAQGRPELVIVAWKVRALLVIFSLGLVSWGIYRGPLVSKFSTAP